MQIERERNFHDIAHDPLFETIYSLIELLNAWLEHMFLHRMYFLGGSACKVVYIHKDDCVETDERKTVSLYMDIQNRVQV